ncbi:MAG: phospho-N-acetylmuramoyl-pentapeptide-transferase, partial [Actinomycetota bacterium]
MIAVMIAGAVAMVVALIATRGLITFFRTRGKGQPILGKEDHGPEHHLHKQGTPTMGGLAIIGAAFVGWFAAHARHGLVFSTQAMIMWCGILVMAAMGLLDDYIKVTRAHNRGIFWKRKGYITLGLAVLMAWWLAS